MKRKILASVTFSLLFFSCGHLTAEKTSTVTDNSAATFVDHWSGVRTWEKPTFANQKGALGWDENAFSVAPDLRARVDFWKRVYAEIHSQEGFIHDIEEPFTVYQLLSLQDIYADESLTAFQKEKAVEKRLEDAKKKIAAQQNLPEERIRFQRGLKERFQRAIYVSGRYLSDFENIFATQGLPKELTRLVFVESSFNVLARSKVGASGLWQIMPSHARSARMISSDIDKRNDPFEATVMAAKILRDNYLLLGSWPLALTAYNHGPTGVRKLTETYKTKDLGELIRTAKSRRSFAFASKNFYACFLAALEVEKEADRYFKPALWATPLNHTKITLNKKLSREEMLVYFGGNESQFLQWNPHFVAAAPNRRNVKMTPYMYIPNVIQPPAMQQVNTDNIAVNESPVKVAPTTEMNDVSQPASPTQILRWPAALSFN